MSIQARGGIPRYLNLPIPAAGTFVEFPQLSIWVRLKVSAAAKVFASQADMEANQNFAPVSSAEVWELPLEDRGLFIKGDAGAITADLAVILRKA